MSTLPTPHLPSPARVRPPSPPLESGDRLNHAEYIRRYAAMPSHVKAERIEGVVYMAAAAVSADFHGRPHADMTWWLGTYRMMTPGTAAADNSTIFLDLDNDPQPDLCLYTLPSHGGRIKIDGKGYIVGSPELIVEIAASSLSFDLGAKLQVYRRNGVREYIVHRTYDGEIDWFILRDGQYERLAPGEDGIHRSEAFPGLWLPATSMIEGDLVQVMGALQRGCAGGEHGAFVKALGVSQEAL